ncbi:hypothetical protein CPB85DRAFT_1433801 [Mucidula mucida]|nr:hypothetical protein CPB85DRAFT_1433801 [Mucidula mucida]
MPDFSIPNNAIPIHLPPGTRALADMITHKVLNPHFWPEDVPHPNQEFQFPHISLITKGFRIAPKRAFNRSATETQEDRKKLDEYHQSSRGESFKPTIELKNAWLEKYQRRDAFFHRKKVHDLVRRKDKFMNDEGLKQAKKRLEEEGVELKSVWFPTTTSATSKVEDFVVSIHLFGKGKDPYSTQAIDKGR